MNWSLQPATMIAALAVGMSSPLKGITINGFVLDEAVIPVTHIKRAAPEKDYIPSIDDTKWLSASEQSLLSNEDEVISVTVGAETRAYPLRILVWHEIVNDTIGDTPVVVTYSALTGSAIVFEPGITATGERREFGGSGLLYNSGILFYDRENEYLWSQLRMSGVSGEACDEELPMVPSRRLTWAVWKRLYPQGQVLSPETGHERDYAGEWPYSEYANDRATLFPFDINRNEFSTKERVVGLRIGEYSRCWPMEKLRGKGELYDTVGTHQVTVKFDEKNNEVLVADMMTGKPMPVVSTYWFGWQAFYPDTSVWIPFD